MGDNLLLLLFAEAVVLVFPIFAAYRLFKRQQRKLGWATLLTIPLLVGWAVGIYGLTRPRPAPITLDEPCPGCGSHEGSRHEVMVDRASGERTTGRTGAVLGLIWGIGIIGGAVVLAVSIWAGGDEGIIQWEYGSKVAGLAALMVGLALGGPGLRLTMEYFSADRVRAWLYNCDGCGKSWTSQTGTVLTAPA